MRQEDVQYLCFNLVYDVKMCRSPTLCCYLQTIIDLKWHKQGSLSCLGLLGDGACTDLFENLSVSSETYRILPLSTHPLFSHWSIPLM